MQLTYLSIFLIGLTSITALSCSCDNSFITNNQCYCGEEARKLNKCIRKKSPNWPFLKVDDKWKGKSCPSPITDSTGFNECINSKMPKSDPDANTISSDCVTETKAVPTRSSDSGANFSDGTTVVNSSGGLTQTGQNNIHIGSGALISGNITSDGKQLNLSGNGKRNAFSCNCGLGKARLTFEGKCYCADEAEKMLKCARGKNPDWPMKKNDKKSEDCGDPTEDADKFEKCMDDTEPKQDPDKKKIGMECLKSTKAKSIGDAFITKTRDGKKLKKAEVDTLNTLNDAKRKDKMKKLLKELEKMIAKK